MDFVDKKTGEIIEVGEIKLSRLMKGELDEQFRYMLNDLAAHLDNGDKGKIKITIEAMGDVDEGGTFRIIMAAELAATYPKVKLKETHLSRLDDKGSVIDKIDKNLFMNITMEKPDVM